MYKAIFVDIDGTLRHDDKTITERTINSIKKIRSLGIYVILCTGRSRSYTEPISRMLGASEYIITSGGAEVYNYQERKIIYHNPMDISSCRQLYDLAIKNNVKIAMNLDEVKAVNYLTKKDGTEILLPSDIDDFLLKNKVLQCIISDNDYNKIKSLKEDIDKIANVMIVNQAKCLLDNSLKPIGTIYYDVAKYDTSKGNGIKKLCQYLNIELADTIGIGDDYNDFSMFKVVGHSVAMGNASDNVKKIVNEVIKSNNEDGVADYLETLYSNIK